MGNVASAAAKNLTSRHVLGALCGLAAFVHLRSDCDVYTRLARTPRFYYRGKVVWVTGASSGIGRAICEELAAREADIVISARREDALEQLADELLALGARSVRVVAVDLSRGASVAEDAARRALGIHGRLDVLVNNAGVSTRVSARELELDGVHELFEINLFAPIALARACLPALTESGGTVINTSSISSYVATPLRSSYTASKAALDRYFTSFALENPRVHVLSLCPGSTVSNVSLNALAGGGARWGKMDDAIRNGLPAQRVAERALAAAASGLSVAWVAAPKEMLATRLACYAPDVWQRLAPSVFANYAQQLGREQR